MRHGVGDYIENSPIMCVTGKNTKKAIPELVRGSVTANIGWYVVSILHDQPSCNINITWPVESTLWVKFVLISVQICVLPFSCRYYMIGVSCNIDSK